MKKILRLFLLSLLIIAVGTVGSQFNSQASVGAIRVVAAEALTPAQTQSDFDLMRKALEEAHSGLYRYSTKADMDRIFDKERAKLGAMTRTEFLLVFVRNNCSNQVRAYRAQA
jgi:hypothetical protein